MAKESDNRFYYYASAYLQDEFPEKMSSLTQEAIKEFVDKGIVVAGKYGFSTQAEVMTFIDVDLRLDGLLSQETLPEGLSEILEKKTVTAEEKLSQLKEAYCTLEWLKQNDR